MGFAIKNKVLFLFFILLECLSPQAQTLTLYAIPSPHKINWKTPHQLVLSISRNFLVKNKKDFPSRPLGHIVVELQKGTDTLLTGMAVDKKKDFFTSVFSQKYGLGVLFKLMDGRLEKREALVPEIEARLKSGKIAFITFNINDSSWYYLKNYIDSFQRLGYDKMYNGLNQPRHGEGAGCSAFGMSFLELINALQPEFNQEWMINISIPDRLIGGEITNTEVRLRKVFFSFKWARDKTPHTHLSIFDPTLIYSWIQKKFNAEQPAGSQKYRLSSIGKAKGIILDYQRICKPQFPTFLKTTNK